MNRGSDEVEFHSAGARVASMRPRFMNRGSDAEQRREAHLPQGFNEAPIHESGK